jgi:squalene monooxygenase
VEGIDGQVANGYSVWKKSSNEWVQLPFPVDPETGKPHKGVSFHHGRFIQNLRVKARENHLVNMVEGTVLSLIEDGDAVVGVKYKTKDGQVFEVKAPLTVVADGCFSKFRKTLVSNEPKTVSHFVGVVMNDVTLPHEGNGHVFLVDPSPVLSYRIGTNDVRVLVDVPGTVLPQNMSSYLLETTATQLPEAVRQSFINAVQSGNIKSMPNQKLHPNPIVRRGVLPLGDAYNMRHPLTGGGMTVALSDTACLVDLIKDVPDLADVPLVHDILDEFYTERKPLASTINILAFALYQIFCGGSDDPAVVESVRQACFGYFKLGGSCVEGPMSLLSGLAPSSYFLLYHYVRVAFYGAYQVLIPPTPSKLVHAVKVLRAAYGIFAPLMSAERVTPIDLVTRPAEYKPYQPSVAAH